MKTYELKATPRVDLGKKAAAALRAEGLIPAVIDVYKRQQLYIADG